MTLVERFLSHRAENTITDGRTTVRYADLPQEWSRLEQLWNHVSVESDTAVTLVDRRDLGTVIAAMHFMASQKPWYLWRAPPDIGQGSMLWERLPEFCDAAVMTQSVMSGEAPSISYEIARRDLSGQANAPLASPYIYLRTSGTTSHPKLTAYTPERLLRNAENCVRRFRLTAEDRVLIPLPLAHMYGFGAAFLPAVLAGASVSLPANVNLLTYLHAERTFDPTVVFLTPALANQLVTARKERRPYRLTVLGADRIDPVSFARYEERHGCTVCVYGSTELGAVASSSPNDAFNRRQNSSGSLMDGVRLVPHPFDEDAHGSTAGVLCFDHPSGMSGYATASGEPELPPDVFQDGVYLTRDLGELNADGDLIVRGRRDDCVKRDGYLVAFSDIERVLEQMPGITRAIVMSGEATPRGAALIAFCVAQNHSFDDSEIKRFCASKLPTYAVPDHVILLQQLPLLTTGKPDRQALHLLIPRNR